MITIPVTPSLLIENLSKQELKEFILELDLKTAEWDFTVDLIKAMIKGLEQDESREFVAKELGFNA